MISIDKKTQEKDTRTKIPEERIVPADHFVSTVAANVGNERLSDADFRDFIRNTLPIVRF